MTFKKHQNIKQIKEIENCMARNKIDDLWYDVITMTSRKYYSYLLVQCLGLLNYAQITHYLNKHLTVE